MSVERMSIIWVDAGGRSTITAIRTSTGASGILSAILADSNGDFLNKWEGTETVNATPTALDLQYPSIMQQAILSFLASDGTIARVSIPAPNISIFLADGQTVDPTAIGGIITACVGTLAAPSQALATSFIGGFLTRKGSTL